MRRLLMKQFMRMTRNNTLPLRYKPIVLDSDKTFDYSKNGSVSHLFHSDIHTGNVPPFGALNEKRKRIGYDNLTESEQYVFNSLVNPGMGMLQRNVMEMTTYGATKDTLKKIDNSVDRMSSLTIFNIDKMLSKLMQNPNMRGDINKMLSNIESSRKIREAFSKAKPEQWKIMERLIETRNLDPIRSGNIVTKLPTHAMVSALTDRDFAKLVNADYKQRLDFKYARVINKGNVEKAMISLREHILGEQYHLSEYQRAQLEILMDDMTVDDFDNFYKTRFGHIVNEVFYSSDSRMMMQTTPYELFDDDVDPPKPGRTMGITEKDKIFNKFVSSLQVYMGVDDDTLDALVWEKLGRKG